MSELRPKQVLCEMAHQMPQIWQQVKMFRGDKGKSLPDWPDWCYIPFAAGMAIATQGDDSVSHRVLREKILNPAAITAAAAWRVSQGVYRFDADLYNSLISQPMDDNIPCDVLKHLPEWCVYIETIDANYLGKPIDGFWAHLEKDMNDGHEELRFVFFCTDGQLPYFPLHIGDWTIEEGLKKVDEAASKQAEKVGIIWNHPEILPQISQYITPFTQLILYLCAGNADIPRIKHPNTRVRMSGQVDVPREARVWTVGERIGTAIRRYRNTKEYHTEVRPSGQTHASPRPHIRRAHWHHFWAGPHEGTRKLVLHWLPPIPVNIDGDTDLPAVIHRVE